MNVSSVLRSTKEQVFFWKQFFVALIGANWETVETSTSNLTQNPAYKRLQETRCRKASLIFGRNYLLHFLWELCRNVIRILKEMFDIVTNFAKFAVLVQTCKILVRNAKLARISEDFCKIFDSCNLGIAHSLRSEPKAMFGKLQEKQSTDDGERLWSYCTSMNLGLKRITRYQVSLFECT